MMKSKHLKCFYNCGTIFLKLTVEELYIRHLKEGTLCICKTNELEINYKTILHKFIYLFMKFNSKMFIMNNTDLKLYSVIKGY